MAWTSFYANATSRMSLCAPEAGATTNMAMIPALLHLPHMLTNFIITQSRTCGNVFAKVL